MPDGPRVCILASQYFGWGTYGGFGSMARNLAEHLQAGGHCVTVIVPRRPGQAAAEVIGGVSVLSFPALDIGAACRLINQAAADIFHSQDPTLLTYLAQRLRPECAHLITCRDPRDWRDWWIELRYATARRRALMPFHWLTESGPAVYSAVRKADGVFCPAHFLRDKVQKMYGLKTLPGFLPNLIDVPVQIPPKCQRPTFIFVARFDKRKRPELYFKLAQEFPQYHFVAVGQGTRSAEGEFDAELRRRYSHLPNLHLTGFIDRFSEPERLNRLLGQSWALVNTAAREGLPLTFLEAAAHGCAILSGADPDGFATRFGQQAVGDEFAPALRQLLQESPLDKGRAGRAYVAAHYENGPALEAHRRSYEQAGRARA